MAQPPEEDQLPAPATALCEKRPRLKRVYQHFKKHLQNPSAPSSGSTVGSFYGKEDSVGPLPSIEKDDVRQVQVLPDDRREVVVVTNQIEKGTSREWEKRLKNIVFLQEGASTVSLIASHHSTRAETIGPKIEKSRIYTWATRLGISIFPPIQSFLDQRFSDPKEEAAYQKDYWSRNKRLAIFASAFYPVMWFSSLIFLPRPFSPVNMIVYYILAPILAMPVPFCIIYDCNRRFPIIYQIYLFCATWIWSLGILADAAACDYWDGSSAHCNGKDFSAAMFCAAAFPVVAVIALRQVRLAHVWSTIMFTIVAANIAGTKSRDWGRNCLIFVFFSYFISMLSFMRDKQDRKVYQLTAQLKSQFKATQRAQAAEQRASESKRRLVNYMFHEIRVPLNTSLLAVQNLEAEGIFDAKPGVDIDVEKSALVGGLSIVKQILDDTLDFSSLDAGRFKLVARTFSLHRCMKSMVGAIKVGSQRRNVDFQMSYDDRIDSISPGGMVLGDEMRLRQLVNNLTSNAIKFVNVGGKVTLRVDLVFPASVHLEVSPADSGFDATQEKDHHEKGEEEEEATSPQPQQLVVRISVADSGPGIAQEDMENAKLFSPYVQTEIGRAKGGGKGTGLGLAVVRHIVTLSNGRLGLISKVGEGSTFWIELPFVIPSQDSAYSSTLSKAEAGGADDDEDDEDESRAKLRRNSDFAFAVLSHPGFQTPTLETYPPPRPFTSMSSSPKSPEIIISPSSAPPEALNTLSEKQLVTSAETVTTTITPASPIPLSPSSELYSLSSAPVSPIIPDALHTEEPEEISTSLSVLVVDDDPMTRKLMSKMLIRLGHKPSVAEDGVVGLDMILSSPPHHYDLIFLDNFMPRMSGVEVIAEARAQGRKEFVCGATGNALKNDQDEYLSAGLDYILTKPIMKDALAKALDLAKTTKLARE